jgi:hypothetical protein
MPKAAVTTDRRASIRELERRLAERYGLASDWLQEMIVAHPALVDLVGDDPFDVAEYRRHHAGKSPAIIFDRDGTLASVELARAHVTDGRDDWAQFNAAMLFDAPVPRIAALFQAVRPGIDKIITSGRDGSLRPRMIWWLHKHDIVPARLLMRTPKDNRRDSTVKLEILQDKILPTHDVLFVVDDRPQVVQMWRDQGFDVMAVQDPGVDPPITRHWQEFD